MYGFLTCGGLSLRTTAMKTKATLGSGFFAVLFGTSALLLSAGAIASPSSGVEGAQPQCDGDKHGGDEDESFRLCDGDKHGGDDEESLH